jgi:putative transposase
MNLSLSSFVRKGVNSLCQAAKQRVRGWTKPENHRPTLNAVMDLTRSKPELILEKILLRQQLIVLKRQMKRPALTWRDRTLFVLMASRLRTRKQVLVIVQPETVLRWHPELFRRVWRRKSRARRRGKPPLTQDIADLIRQMAQENLSWGAEHIRGELLKLGLWVSKSCAGYLTRPPGFNGRSRRDEVPRSWPKSFTLSWPYGNIRSAAHDPRGLTHWGCRN